MSKINFHYAYQICDTKSRENKPRICGDDRTLLSKKSIKSFLNSLVTLNEFLPESEHTVCFFNDHSSEELIQYVNQLIEENNSENLKLILQDTIDTGICQSIKQCYMWLQQNGKDFVYQVQDDYLFFPSALKEMYEVINQLKFETGYDIVVSPFNDFWLWLAIYRNSCTPRTVVVGKDRYWIQYYDMSCSFMTIHKEFSKHWDLYHEFFNLLEQGSKELESKSLNYMLTKRAYGFIPVNNLAFHMQTELEEDPHIDWRPLWESINVTSSTT